MCKLLHDGGNSENRLQCCLFSKYMTVSRERQLLSFFNGALSKVCYIFNVLIMKSLQTHWKWWLRLVWPSSHCWHTHPHMCRCQNLFPVDFSWRASQQHHLAAPLYKFCEERKRWIHRYSLNRILWLSLCDKNQMLWLFSQFLIPNAIFYTVKLTTRSLSGPCD